MFTVVLSMTWKGSRVVDFQPFGWSRCGERQIALLLVDVTMPQIMEDVVLLVEVGHWYEAVSAFFLVKTVKLSRLSMLEGDWRNDRRKSACWGCVWSGLVCTEDFTVPQWSLIRHASRSA